MGNLHLILDAAFYSAIVYYLAKISGDIRDIRMKKRYRKSEERDAKIDI